MTRRAFRIAVSAAIAGASVAVGIYTRAVYRKRWPR